MKPSEFAEIVVDMLQTQKEVFIEMMTNNDWDMLTEEVLEYVDNMDTD